MSIQLTVEFTTPSGDVTRTRVTASLQDIGAASGNVEADKAAVSKFATEVFETHGPSATDESTATKTTVDGDVENLTTGTTITLSDEATHPATSTKSTTVTIGEDGMNEKTASETAKSDDANTSISPASVPKSETVQIFVNDLKGKTSTFEVCLTDTVRSLKMRIYDRLSIPPRQQRLICAGRQLESRRTLQDFHVHKESTVHLVLRLSGS